MRHLQNQGTIRRMKVHQFLAAAFAVQLSNCGFAPRSDIPVSHPRTVVLEQDLLLHNNPLRRRPIASETEDPHNPTQDVVKRGTRITFDTWLNEQFIVNPGAYLLCRTEEEKPRVFEYFVGPSGGITYLGPPPWELPPGSPHIKYCKRPPMR